MTLSKLTGNQNQKQRDPQEAHSPLLITLVVPIRDEELSLSALVDSIGKQTLPPDEIILVDGGSKDRTVELARELTVHDSRFRVLEAQEATPGRGRNVGIAAAKHEWIALTDAGIELEETWLENLVAVVEQDPLLEMVYGNYEPVTNTFFNRCAALAYVPAKRPKPDELIRGPFIASSLIRRHVWRAVGGFPDLRAAEDLIFMERVEKQGFKIGWATGATVHWQLQPTLASTFRKFVLYSKHNVWAGRQQNWHRAVARMYLVALSCICLALFHTPWWMLALFVGATVRVGKSIWCRREERGLFWALNPMQFVGVAVILLTIDMATFLGWIQALLQRPRPIRTHHPNQFIGKVDSDRSPYSPINQQKPIAFDRGGEVPQ